ncbi:heavy metal translocating P-type ATPase [Reinekea sp.]|uniref:heavy metal translocating P-type ATPase n=1 Tax=Reinekea sp. TaxID=1970455 RepID=UPI002A8400E3|nr:heavy metal translocating P-type ATPase [Reinekea sp.]
MTATTCFHCGLLNADNPFVLTVLGEPRSFCCLGCQAAAQTIVDTGLGEYYRFHQPDQQPVDTALSEKQQQALRVYDRDDVQNEFTTRSSDGSKSALFLIEGISCSACTWLIEKRLQQLPGVAFVAMNAATHRLSIQWRPADIQLSDIVKTLLLIGYRAAPYLPDEAEQVRQRTQRQFILRLGVAGIGMMQAMMNAVALYSGDIGQVHERWLWWTSLVLTLPVILISAWPFFTAAGHALKGRQLSMDVSVSIAILSAFLASVWATVTGQGEVFYESVNMFTFFLVLSRFLEFRARTLSSTQGNALVRVLPATCSLVEGGSLREISIRDLLDGQVIRLLPGETSPCDGTVVRGQSEFDESSFSGEFKGSSKNIGDPILAGTINQLQSIDLRVSHVATGSAVNFLQQLVDRASAEKPRIAELADQGSRQFIWSTLLAALLIGLVWLWYDPERAFWVVISVLVVTCPCALSLATPTALAQAMAQLKKQGFVITRGYVLERLAQLTEVAFDKTGTLTEGRFDLSEFTRCPDADRYGLSEAHLKYICGALEQYSEHAMASALKPLAQEFSSAALPIEAVEAISGAGIQGQSAQGLWRLGSAVFTNFRAQESASEGTRLYLTCNGDLMAKLRLTDRLRSTVAPLFGNLAALQIRTHVLTGDSNTVAETRLRAAGLSGQFIPGCRPEDKLRWVEQRAANPLAVVGDGLNDAPFLAGAAVSIAMLEATDLTKTQADVLLFTNDLQVIAKAIRLARRTKRIIRQNLIWALLYNLLALPIAALGLVAPWQAAIGMSVSSLIVVGNASRLRK